MGVTRDELYQQVWKEPMTSIAGRYGVSSSFLARVCTAMNVPRPPRGYWEQLKVGRAPERSLLPEAQPNIALEWLKGGGARLSQSPPTISPKPRQTRPSSERPSQHNLLAGIWDFFKKAVTDGDYLRPHEKLLVDVVVSKDALSCALDFANEQFLFLEDRGHSVVLAQGFHARPDLDQRELPSSRIPTSRTSRPARPTVVYVRNVAIGLTLYEMSEGVEVRWVKDGYVRVTEISTLKRKSRSSWNSWTTKRDLPSGRLALRAHCPYHGVAWRKEWRESAQGEMQGIISGIARTLEREAPAIAKLMEAAFLRAKEDQERWEEQSLEWKRQDDERRRIQAMKESRDDLLKTVEAWAQARQIEDFFADAEDRSVDMPTEARAELLKRLDRARLLLGGVDALQRFKSWKPPEERFP